MQLLAQGQFGQQAATQQLVQQQAEAQVQSHAQAQNQLDATTQSAAALADYMQSLSTQQQEQVTSAVAPIKEEVSAINAQLAALPEEFKAQGQQLQSFMNTVTQSMQQALAHQAQQGSESMAQLAAQTKAQMDTLLASNQALAAMTTGLGEDIRKQLGVLPGLAAQQHFNQEELKAGLDKLSGLNMHVFQGTAMAHEAAMQNANAMNGLAMNIAAAVQEAASETGDNAKQMASVLGQMRQQQQTQQQLSAENEKNNAMLIGSLNEAITGVGHAIQNIAGLRGDVDAMRTGLRNQLEGVLANSQDLPQMMRQMRQLSHAMTGTMPDLAKEISGNLDKLSDVMQSFVAPPFGQSAVTVSVTTPSEAENKTDDEAGLVELKNALLASAKAEVESPEQQAAAIEVTDLRAKQAAIENQLKAAHEAGLNPESIQNELAEINNKLREAEAKANARTASQTMTAAKNWLFNRVGSGIGKFTDKNGFFRKAVLPVAGLAYNAASAVAFATNGTSIGSLPVTKAAWDEFIGNAGKTATDLKETVTGTMESAAAKKLAGLRQQRELLQGQIYHDPTNAALKEEVTKLTVSIEALEGGMKLAEERKKAMNEPKPASTVTVEMTDDKGKKRVHVSTGKGKAKEGGEEEEKKAPAPKRKRKNPFIPEPKTG